MHDASHVTCRVRLELCLDSIKTSLPGYIHDEDEGSRAGVQTGLRATSGTELKVGVSEE